MDGSFNGKQCYVHISKTFVPNREHYSNLNHIDTYTHHGLHRGHIVARADYSGNVVVLIETYGYFNFTAMYPEFNCVTWCKKGLFLIILLK